MESQVTESQAPKRSQRLQDLPDPSALPLRNHFTVLPREVVEEDIAYSRKYPKLYSQNKKIPGVCKTKKRTQEVSPTKTDRSRSTQPYRSSYFLPRKILSKAATFLLKTGCTTKSVELASF